VYFVRLKNPTGDANAGDSRVYVLRIEARKLTGSNRTYLQWTAFCSQLFCGAPFVQTIRQKIFYTPQEYCYASLMPRYEKDIFHYAISKTVQPTEVTIRFIVAQVLLALDCMHQRGFAHRDLSGANIMLDDAASVTPRVHVGDFGYTTYYNPCAEARVPSDLSVGTMPYLSPEALLGCPQCDPFKGDIWALGINMLHLMTKQLVWLGNPQATPAEKRSYQIKHTFTELVSFDSQAWNDEAADPAHCAVASEATFDPYPAFSQQFSSDAKDVLRMLLQSIPSARPTARVALNHPWFSSEPTLFNSPHQNTPTPTKSTTFEGPLQC
jgi:serine/threonine protein kinase